MDLNQEFKTTHIELYKLIVKIWTRLEPQIFLQAYMQLGMCTGKNRYTIFLRLIKTSYILANFVNN